MMEECTEAAEKLRKVLAKVRTHLDAECTADEGGYEAALSREAMGNVLDATAKIITICDCSKMW